MIGWLRRRRQWRRARDEAAVVHALSAMRTLPALLLIRHTGLTPRRLHAALTRMQAAGHVDGLWMGGRRVYRLAIARHVPYQRRREREDA